MTQKAPYIPILVGLGPKLWSVTLKLCQRANLSVPFIKMSECQTKAGNQRKFENLKKIENLKKGTLNFARWQSFRVTDHSFGPRPTKIGM